MSSFKLKNLIFTDATKSPQLNLPKYYSPNTLKVDKEKKGWSTFDDGLLFKFHLDKYEHLSYFCRTSTPHMDTCNVKLFKKGPDNSLV